MSKQSMSYREIDNKAVSESKRVINYFTTKYKNKFMALDSIDISKEKIHAVSDRAPLKRAIVSLPTYLDWDFNTSINQAEKENLENRPNRHLAVVQHKNFIESLLKRGVEVLLLTPSKDYKEGVYTRDIGFSIDEKFFHCNMYSMVRYHEPLRIVGGITPPNEVIIEGGNVILDTDVVFLGIGDRTNEIAAEWLQYQLGSTREVISIKLRRGTPKKGGVLHLDCVLCPLMPANGQPGKALLAYDAITDYRCVDILNSYYGDLQIINSADVKALGLNMISLNDSRKITNPMATQVFTPLQNMGFRYTNIDLSEIIKGEGGPRCSTLPLIQDFE
jgi:N-dimethylarginine dimethylaminohydrolase